jgi:hypothetical protein
LAAKLLIEQLFIFIFEIEQLFISGEAYCVARQTIILKNFCQFVVASSIVLHTAAENREIQIRKKEKQNREIQKLLVCREVGGLCRKHSRGMHMVTQSL